MSLEAYFTKPETLDRIRASWLGGPIENYVDWLAERGFAASSVSRRVPVLLHFATFARNSGAESFDELPDLVDDFVGYWTRTRRRKGRTKRAQRLIAGVARVPVEQMLRLLIPDFQESRRRPRPLPFSGTAPGFFDYLRSERGLKESSIYVYTNNLRHFEAYFQRIGLSGFEEISPVILSAFTIESSANLSKGPLSMLCTHVRVFLRYLYRERLIDLDLSTSVDCPRIYRLSSVPRSISWDEVRSVLDGIDRRAAIGKRDFAIILLLVTYGLRAREVAALTLDSIDWQRERLQVPDRKAGHNTAFPLSSVVGEAIIDYIRLARPKSSQRALFLSTKPPFRPVGFEVISDRAACHLRRAGVSVPRPGSHTLRHTCVQRLVDGQFPLKTIGDYIGHSRPKSTEIYTKINLEALREMALGDGEDVL